MLVFMLVLMGVLFTRHMFMLMGMFVHVLMFVCAGFAGSMACPCSVISASSFLPCLCS